MFSYQVSVARVLLVGSLMGAVGVTVNAADSEGARDKSCEAHAVAMVAEMRASAPKPMSADEINLVRATAYKSCLAQAAPAPVAGPVIASSAPAPRPAAVAPKSGDGLGGALQSFLGTDVARKPGNERLEQRSHM